MLMVLLKLKEGICASREGKEAFITLQSETVAVGITWFISYY